MSFFFKGTAQFYTAEDEPIDEPSEWESAECSGSSLPSPNAFIPKSAAGCKGNVTYAITRCVVKMKEDQPPEADYGVAYVTDVIFDTPRKPKGFDAAAEKACIQVGARIQFSI